MGIVRALRLTPADRVTVARAALGAACAVLTLLALAGVLPPRPWSLFLLAAVAALLDAVDGAVARRTGCVSARGARWDMEVDAAFLVVLGVAVAPFAPWALGIGAARYLYGAGAVLRPAWRRPLPFRQSRRVIAGFQAAALVIALAPFLPLWVGQALTAVALASLAFSFGRDIAHQERRTRIPLGG